MKQEVFVHSTADAEYRSMGLTCCEVTWLSSLLKDMGLSNLPPTFVKTDNQAALSIAANSVLHEHKKHIELDCHYIKDKISDGSIVTYYVPTYMQLADILTKPLIVKQHNYLLNKIGASVSPPLHLRGSNDENAADNANNADGNAIFAPA